jgi:hypothetical protein
MESQKIKEILDQHWRWKISDGKDGSRADLTGADLTGADLLGADLSGAYLLDADLTGADLRDADLSGADLRDADLRDADLSGADLSRAKGVYSFGPIGKEGRIGYVFSKDKKAVFKLGCHIGNLADTVKAIREKYGNKSTYEAQVILAAKIVEAK